MSRETSSLSAADCILEDNELLIRLNCTGLCMSDVHYMLNDWAVPPMSHFGVECPGHEGAGVVVKVGKSVTDWKVGDRAGVKPLKDVCHNCEECWNGRAYTLQSKSHILEADCCVVE